MKMFLYLAAPLAMVMALQTQAQAQARCEIPIVGGGTTSVGCGEPPEPPEPPEPNRLAGSDGNPAPNQTRCGDVQIPVSECPMYQNFAWNSGAGCINFTEYNYAI